MTKSRLLILSIIGSALLFVAFVGFGLHRGHSIDYNLSWHRQFSDLFWNGHLLPKFGSDLGFGFGGMDLFFYAPFPFYVSATFGEISVLFSGTPNALAAGWAWLFIFSGIAMYFCARDHFSRNTSAIVAVLYVLAPYHLWIDWFLRSALGEAAAFVFVPIVFMGLLRLVEKNSGFWLLVFGLTGLALSHLPSLALVLIYFVPLFLLLSYGTLTPQEFWKRLLKGLMASLLAAALSAFYWLPALSLLGNYSSDILRIDHMSPENWLFPCFDCVNSSSMVGLLLTIGAFHACFVAAFFSPMKQANTSLSKGIFVILIIFVILNSAIAYPIWKYTPLDFIQFPWRAFVILEIVILLGLGYLIEIKFPRYKILLLLFLLIFLRFAVFFVPYAERGEMYSGEFAPMVTALEYMPQESSVLLVEHLAERGMPPAAVTLFQGDYLSDIRNSVDFGGTIMGSSRGYEVVLSNTDVEIPIFYNPLFEAISKEGVVLEATSSERGLLIIEPRASNFSYYLPMQRSEKVGNLISVFGLLLAALLLALTWYRNRSPKAA